MWNPESKNMSFFAEKAVVLKLHKALVSLQITKVDMLNKITVFFTVVKVSKTQHGETIETSYPDHVSIQGPKTQSVVTKATTTKAFHAVLKTLKDLKPTADFIVAVSKALDY